MRESLFNKAGESLTKDSGTGFPVSICNIFRILFLKNTSGRLLLTILSFFQRQPPEVFYKKGVFKNVAIFTGKHLC